MMTLIASLALGTVLVTCDDQHPLAPRLTASLVADRALTPVADTYVQRPLNANHGAEAELRVLGSGGGRGAEMVSLVRFDSQQIAAATGADSVAAARLELTITRTATDWGRSGHMVAVHRLTQAWTELGATWTCAVQARPADHGADCSGAAAWTLSGPEAPWAEAPTDSHRVTNGLAGVLSFDVTTDVRAFLGGTANHGWVVRRAAETGTGRITLSSREGASPPRLVLSIVPQDTSRPAVPTNIVYPRDTLFIVTNPADTGRLYYRRLYEILFTEGASGSSIRALLAKYRAQIVAGGPFTGSYIVMMPDPGATWQAVQARSDSIHQEPIVAAFMPLIRRDHPPVNRGRFPADGFGHARSNWFDGSASTWAHLAIGAPLAWGCETGGYSPAETRVGILEWRFDTAPTDLAASHSILFSVAGNADITEADTTRVKNERHGAAVAATLSAEGDNGQGIAGMVWKSDLRFYALGTQDLRNPDSYSLGFREQLLPRVIEDKPMVLSVSTGFGGSPDNADETRLIVRAAMRLFRESARTLVVVAGGNAGTNTSIDQLLGAKGSQLGFDAALARIARDSGFAHHIVFVAGTMPMNQRWTSGAAGSDFMPGLVQIAAPASQVPTIWGDSEALATGTSFAAPLVAGVAAQLWAMDSTLLPGQIKQYLIRGASEPYEDYPGHAVAPAPVIGFSQPVYQLNAYRSLRLLSAERPGTPICGYPVRVSDAGTEIVLDAPAPAGRTFAVPGSTWISGMSVAQGGRLIAVQDYDGDYQQRTVLFDHNGSLLSVHVGERRSFLERDTLIESWNTGLNYPTFTIRGPTYGSPGLSVNLFSSFASDPSFREGTASIAPSGDYAVLVTNRWTSGCDESMVSSLYFEPLSGGIPVEVASASSCTGASQFVVGGDYNPSAWSHDGRQFIMAYADDFGAQFVQAVSPPATARSPQQMPENRVVFAPNFTADDSLVQWWEQSGSLGETCELSWRAPLPNYGIVLLSPVAASACGLPRRLPNAPPARSRSRVTQGAFRLLDVGSALLGPGSRRSVQVN